MGKFTIKGGFWGTMQDLALEVILPHQADILDDKAGVEEKSYAIENFRIAAGESEGEFHGMVFQDSDVAKWLEAVAYALCIKPNPTLEKKADELIALISRAQEADGYLNTYFTVKEPQHKWKNLQECHELYCSGHMIEAAVAYYKATGKDTLLQVMCKNADLICNRFGKSKTRGVPGHQEIELALIRLYHVTGKKEYLETAKYFLEERGCEPDFFTEETEKRGWVHWGMTPTNREYAQNHLPPIQQTEAVGHSVRALYMYTAMASLAAETENSNWLDACKALWDNITQKRMYVTGGVGSTHIGEAFTIDYDLPNDTIYAETCASIALIFFARQMQQIQPKGEYADIIEKALYNGVLSGMQLDGQHFFYVNPLEVVPGVSGKLPGYKHVLPQRPKWYGCACCPPNLARLLTSLGQYAWDWSFHTGATRSCIRATKEDSVFAHLHFSGKLDLQNGVQITCESDYPWGGDIRYEISTAKEADFTFALRIPGWCDDWSMNINKQPVTLVPKDGYVYISRTWKASDTVELLLNIQPKRVYANTNVRANAGCVALQYGPIVYCLEEVDNGTNLAALRLPPTSNLYAKKELLDPAGQIVLLEAEGYRLSSGSGLYSNMPPAKQPVTLHAVPYYTWGNRKPGAMRVWMLEDTNAVRKQRQEGDCHEQSIH